MMHFPNFLALKWRQFGLLLTFPLLLFGCQSGHVLMSKAQFSAADQCLLNQQEQFELLHAQQLQSAEMLSFLQETVKSHNAQFAEAEAKLAEAESGKEKCVAASIPVKVLNVRQIDKQIVGESEQVLLTNLGIVLKARMDTGATTSSLDARNIQLFERNGDEWVRFSVVDRETGDQVEVERERVRRVLVTQSNSEEPERRPVIEMRVTVGKVVQLAEFTLSDRSHSEFPVLIGRNVLRDVMLVDVSKVNYAPLVVDADGKRPSANAVSP